MRIGIDLGGTKIAGIVMDEKDRTLFRRRLPTPHRGGYEEVLTSLIRLTEELERAAGMPCEIGLGLPGSVSRRSGTLKNCNVRCLNGQPIKKDLEVLLKREIRLANDANCFTRSEAKDGAAQDAQTVFGVILGTGVGGGIAVNGAVLDGANDIAGEWGHMPLLPDGRACYCGRRGCVETALSGAGLLGHYRDAGGSDAKDAMGVAHLARNKTCAKARVALEKYHVLFAQALASVINLLDPHVIVLGGGLSNIASLYSVGTQLLAGQIFNDAQETKIVPNFHGDASGVRGAAMLWKAPDVRRPLVMPTLRAVGQPSVSP